MLEGLGTARKYNWMTSFIIIILLLSFVFIVILVIFIA